MYRSAFLLTVSLILAFAIHPAGRARPKHPKKPIGLVAPRVVARGILPAQTVKIAGLKAAILGGDLDSAQGGEETQQYIEKLRSVAAVLRDRGVAVTEIYTNVSRGTIDAAVRDAHFVFYAGHGLGQADPPKYEAEGIDGEMLIIELNYFSSHDIKKWKVKRNALVFFIGACFTAGNAGDDFGLIDAAEAERRITDYSKTYLTSNYAGYYATISETTAQGIVAKLFAGATLGEAYGLDLEGVSRVQHRKAPGNELWYQGLQNGPRIDFTHAFAGKPGERLTTLFGGADNLPPVPVPVDNEALNKALITAIYSGNTAAALGALQQGASGDAEYSGWTASMLAAYYNRPAILAAILKKKPDLTRVVGGFTALALAEKRGLPKIAAMLKTAGAKTDRTILTTMPKPAPL